MIDWGTMSIVISTHKRPAMLQHCATTWAKTAPAYRKMFVLVNHPEGDVGFLPPSRCEVIHTGRIPEHAGCMSHTWNMGMQWAFRDPKVEWLLCSMDDLLVTNAGWAQRINERDPYDFYLAPAGDLCFLFNRTVFKQVGWFDERFRMIGWQEWDYQARVIRALGVKQVSIQDNHGWNFNPIGLGDFWSHGPEKATTRSMSYDESVKAWMLEKWGCDLGTEIHQGNLIRPPQVPEIEWYPWFNRG